MTRIFQKLTSLLLGFLMIFSNATISFADSKTQYSALGVSSTLAASPLQLWTENWRIQIFKDTQKPALGTSGVQMVTAKNDYESAQIALRSDVAFTIQQVSFSELNNGTSVIPASSITSNFVGYVYLPKNGDGRDPTNMVRRAPGDFPEYLLNDLTMEVPANTTQPIWATVYIPAEAATGVYTGAATITTTLGDVQVPMEVEVFDVVIPPSNAGEFTYEFWSQLYKQWEVTDRNMRGKDLIRTQYGIDSGSEEYWILMEQFAELFQKNRFNSLMVPLSDLLLDGGSVVDEHGVYTFDFSLFDEFCSFFIDRGAVKWLAGTHLCHGITAGGAADDYAVEYLDQDASGMFRSFGNLTSPSEKIKAENYLNQLVPQLKAHLEEKGWEDMWRWHVGDEPNSSNKLNSHKAVDTIIRNHWSAAIIGDAIYPNNIPVLAGSVNSWTPELSSYEANKTAFDARAALGETVWSYTCLIPKGKYLNRFIDQQLYKGEMIGWFNNLNRLPGFLHWGLMEQGVWDNEDTHNRNNPGDGWSIYPDAENQAIISSIRIDAAREMSEDYELLEIVRKGQGDTKTNSFIKKIVTSGTSYSSDVNRIIAVRNELVELAANLDPEPPAPQEDGVAYWSFNQDHGTALLDEWGGNDAMILHDNIRYTAEGKLGGGLRFAENTPQHQAVITSPDSVSDVWSASMWVYYQPVANLNGCGVLEGSSSALTLNTWDRNGGIDAAGIVSSADLASSYTVPKNEWVKLVWVMDGTATKLYADGLFQDTIPASIACPLGYIGSYGFTGILDELKVYSTALTPEKILQDYNSDIGGDTPQVDLESVLERAAQTGINYTFAGSQQTFDGSRIIHGTPTDKQRLAEMDKGTVLVRFKTRTAADQVLFAAGTDNAANNYGALLVNGKSPASYMRMDFPDGMKASLVDTRVTDGNWHTFLYSVDRSALPDKYGKTVTSFDGGEVTQFPNFASWFPGTPLQFLTIGGSTGALGGFPNGQNFVGEIAFVAVVPEVFTQEEAALLTASETEPTTKNIFSRGDATGSDFFRIPFLMTTAAGTLVAGTDANFGSTGDSAENIDAAIIRKEKAANHAAAKGWGAPTVPDVMHLTDYPDEPGYKQKSASFIDGMIVQDAMGVGTPNRILLQIDAWAWNGGLLQHMNVGANGQAAGGTLRTIAPGDGFATIGSKKYLLLSDQNVKGNGNGMIGNINNNIDRSRFNYVADVYGTPNAEGNYSVYHLMGTPVPYSTTAPTNDSNLSLGSISRYALNENYELIKDNLPLTVPQKNANSAVPEKRVPMNMLYEESELQVYNTSYLYQFYSDDDGITWRTGPIVSGMVKREDGGAYITGPGRGIQLKYGEKAGRILFPVYYQYQGSQRTETIYSDDGGDSWHRGASVPSNKNLSEAALTEMPDGSVKIFIRTATNGGLAVTATSTDAGESWQDVQSAFGDSGVAVNCQLSAINLSSEIISRADGNAYPAILLSTAFSSARKNGRISVGLIKPNGTYPNGAPKYRIDWEYQTVVTPSDVLFGYSCLTELPDGRIGMLYETSPTQNWVDGLKNMTYQEFTIEQLTTTTGE